MTQNMNHVELEKSFGQFFSATRPLLRQVEEAVGVPQRKRVRVSFEGSSGMRVSEELVPDFGYLVLKTQGQLEKLEEYRSVAAALEANSSISRLLGKLVGTEHFRRHLDASDLISWALVSYLDRTHLLGVVPVITQEVITELLQFSTAEVFPMLAIAPLSNLQSDLTQVSLSDEGEIRVLGGDEISELFENLDSISYPPFYLSVSQRSAIAVRFSTPFVIQEAGKEEPPLTTTLTNRAFSVIDNILTALRLVAPGNVHIAFVHLHPLVRSPIAVESTRYLPPAVVYPGPTYSLDEELVSRLRETFNSLSRADLSKNQQLLVALTRFNFSYERGRPEDRLIDLFIAAEALRGEPEGPEFPEMLATMLNLDPKGQHDVREAWLLRNAIVHGSSLGREEGRKAADYAKELERVIARLIVRQLGIG